MRLRMVVETPRGAHVKRGPDGRVDFVSPVACPYHYGSLPGTRAEDGEPVDALHLRTSRQRSGDVLEGAVVGRVGFVDLGIRDDKWVLADAPPTADERAALERFFVRYAFAKRLVARLRGDRRELRALGFEAGAVPDEETRGC